MSARKIKNVTIQKLPESIPSEIIDGANVTPIVDSQSIQNLGIKGILGLISQFVTVGGDFAG